MATRNQKFGNVATQIQFLKNVATRYRDKVVKVATFVTTRQTSRDADSPLFGAVHRLYALRHPHADQSKSQVVDRVAANAITPQPIFDLVHTATGAFKYVFFL
jgi:hypothetical protein